MSHSNPGKLGILLPGMGAVSTTLIAGVHTVRRGLGRPIGSLTQLGSIELKGKRVPITEALGLPHLEDLVFGGWDIHDRDCYDVALESGVLERDLLARLEVPLRDVRPMPAVFDTNYVKRLRPKVAKTGRNWMDLADQLRKDIQTFKHDNGVDRVVVVWCASTETFMERADCHQSLRQFESALKTNDPAIAPSMVYAYAALSEGVPFANGAPNLCLDIPAMMELAHERRVPICGKDFKTGQTMIKTVLAPMLRERHLGLSGWFSTNILGNRDGEVLDDPGSFKTKESSKLSVLESILDADAQPDLYGDFSHKVRINYYPPRGDNKEGWDNIDISGWLGYPMQIKVNFLCRDSILAAPLALDMALLLDRAKASGERSVQSWLSFFFKAPMTPSGGTPVHDLFQQANALRSKMEEMARTA